MDTLATLLILLSLLLAGLAGGAMAQSYPTRPVTLVVGFPPGGGADAWLQWRDGRWDADEGYEGTIGFEWDRIALHRMLNKIISAPQENNARRLPSSSSRSAPSRALSISGLA